MWDLQIYDSKARADMLVDYCVSFSTSQKDLQDTSSAASLKWSYKRLLVVSVKDNVEFSEGARPVDVTVAIDRTS